MCSTAEGQVLHIRKLSRKLIFIDIEPSEPPVPENRLTIALKTWECGEEVAAAATKGPRKIHPGDTVVFGGYFEDHTTFSATSFEVKKFWCEEGRGVFHPQPPSDELKNVATTKSESSMGLCKYFLNNGHCPKTCCRFSHQCHTSDRVTYVREKKERQVMNHEAGGCSTGEQDSCVAGSTQRAAVFAAWIVAKYNEDWLRQEGLILDVAGGRGDVAFELATRRGLSCAVVDPRPLKLKRWQVNFKKKNPNALVPEHFQTYFDDSFLESLLGDESRTRVCLVLGLHPDEATEPLVSAALKHGLDFAVVPCCVFSSSFPNRKLEDGRKPSSYELFCDYLKEKDDRIQEERLNFIGKNKVLFLQQNR